MARLVLLCCLLCWQGVSPFGLTPRLPSVRGRSSVKRVASSSASSLEMKVAIPTVGMPLSVGTVSAGANTFLFKLQTAWKTFGLLMIAWVAKVRAKISSKAVAAVNAMETGWVKRGTGGAFSRTVEVYSFAFSFAYKFIKSEKLKKTDMAAYEQSKRELAVLLRDKLLELGPTFIKLGQLLSTRIDVLPREYIKELVLLQDQVPGFDGNTAVEIIEKELGKPITELYDTFDRKAIAAASLGQVHVATKDGKKLAVKVQRQGLKKLFDMDLKNIKVLAILLDKFDPKSDGAQRDWVSIYEESARLLYKEIDYAAEAQNAIRFKNNFAGTPWVKVPDVYLDKTTARMVTMEFVPGIKINDIEKIEKAGIDRTLLAKRSAEAYLTQLCRHGFFHCDPHPGNVACDAEEGGRLIFYDFGMMDELKPQTKEGLVNLIFGIYENDVKEVLRALEQIEVLRKGVDKFSVEKIARFFLGEFSSGVKADGKWTSQLPVEEQKRIKAERRKQLGADLFSVGSDVPFKFPPTFTFVFRAFTSLDGIGKGLDSQYDLTKLAQPYLKELVDLRDGSAFLSLAKTVGKALGWRPMDIANAVQSPRKVAYLEDTVSRMEQGDLKLRVRVLESERAFKRMELVQTNMALAVAASGFLNMAIVLGSVTTPTGPAALAARATLALAGLFGLQIPIGLIKLKALDKKYASFAGTS